jgi:hypothetical protein
MERIMKIADCFESARHGWLISGINRELNRKAKAEVERMIGSRIRIRLPDGTTKGFDVHGIDLSKSIADELNITISLGSNVDKSFLIAGADVLQGQ